MGYSMRLKGLCAGAAFAVAVMSGSAALADVCQGACSATGADGVVTLSPTGNSTYQYVTTNGGITDVGMIASVGNGNTPQNDVADGSLLTTSDFAAGANSSLSFYFNYITSDGSARSQSFTDYAWAELETAAGAHVAWLFTAETEPSGNTSPGQGLPADDATLNPGGAPIVAGAPNWSPLGVYSGTCFGAGCGYTGWIQSTYTIAAAGSYKLLFGVTNWGDNLNDSGLAFDGITVTPSDNNPVPEPATIAVMLMGIGFLYGMLRLRPAKASA